MKNYIPWQGSCIAFHKDFASFGVNMTFDLQLIQEPSQALRGFLAAGPYRQRCARGREEDSLLSYIQPRTAAWMSEAELKQWQEELASAYFRSQGSVTMAMRSVFSSIDEQVKAKNRALDPEIPPHVLDVFLGVVHHGMLFGAQSGRVFCLHLKPAGMQLFHENWADDSPIGILSNFESRFFQSPLNEGDVLVIAPELPQSWLEKTSQGINNSLRSIANNLSVLPRGSNPLQAVRLRIGVGQVTELIIAEHLNKEKAAALQLREEARETELQARRQAALRAEEEKARLASLEAEKKGREEAEAQTRLLSVPEMNDLPQAEEASPVVGQEKPALPFANILQRIKESRKPEKEQPLPPQKVADAAIKEIHESRQALDGPTEITLGTMKGIASGAGWLRTFEEKTKKVLDKPVLDRDGVPTPISGLSVMNKLLIALMVPLVIVAIAVAIYLSQGISTQFDRLMNQARGAIASAQSAKTPEQKRDNWQTAFTWLAQAENYKTNDELMAMKGQVQKALDSLTGAVQLRFTKILSAAQTGDQSNITQIVSFGNDLFALDRNAGKVLHMTRDQKGYIFDEQFKCGEGLQQGKMLGKVVAITLIPLSNKHEAPLLALDGGGNAAFCKPGSEAAVISLQQPEGGLGEVQKIHYDTSNGRLYVFAPSANGLWIYTGFSEEFPKQPIPYFDKPAFALQDLADFTINRDESFYLFKDGHSAHCLASSITGNVDCENPVPYLDQRAEKTDGQLNGITFSRLTYAPAPDAAVYYLDPKEISLYQFSLKLYLNDVKRAASDAPFNLSKGVTGLGMAADRMVYLAFGSDLYASPLP
ncbi:MAG: hypothetical protein VB108_09785 [Anaerolineaceae bacterium]|nr:hypothetical protein [Anaerolineaceae bacterium]